MKKWFLIAMAVFGCSILQASYPEKVDVVSARVLLENKTGYFVMSDGSCWKVVGFQKRWRTPSEWWRDIQLAPPNYDTVPSDWVLGSQIEVYTKYDNLNVNEADASNQADLKQCTHLLVNGRTGQILFATALHTADCVVQVYNDAHEQGYNEGYTKGKLNSYKTASDAYDRGTTDGFNQGYTKGYQDAYNGIPYVAPVK